MFVVVQGKSSRGISLSVTELPWGVSAAGLCTFCSSHLETDRPLRYHREGGQGLDLIRESTSAFSTLCATRHEDAWAIGFGHSPQPEGTDTIKACLGRGDARACRSSSARPTLSRNRFNLTALLNPATARVLAGKSSSARRRLLTLSETPPLERVQCR